MSGLSTHVWKVLLKTHDLRSSEALEYLLVSFLILRFLTEGSTHMVRTATCRLGELLAIAKSGIKGVALSLSALILPIGSPLVRKRLWQLNNQR